MNGHETTHTSTASGLRVGGQPTEQPQTPQDHRDPPAEGDGVLDDVFGSAAARPATSQRTAVGSGEIIVTLGARGGVGKSSVALSLAQRAASAGLRAVLVDANIGQGDQRTYLRLANAGLPSVCDAALTGRLRDALVDPDTLNAARSDRLDPLSFALVQAPPPRLADPGRVTGALYLDLCRQARQIADLVVVDTQIIETIDPAGMIDQLIAPLLRQHGAWGLGLCDLSAPGIANLLEALASFERVGVPADRQMAAVNLVPPMASYNDDGMARALSEHACFLGTAFADTTVAEYMNRGRTVAHLPSLAPLLDATLFRVTGLDLFDPDRSPPVSHRGSSGWLRRLRRGGRR